MAQLRMSDSDDDVQLSAYAQSALAEFLAEQQTALAAEENALRNYSNF